MRDALARDLEAAHFAADRAFRQYDATDTQNRLVAAELELRWNRALGRVTDLQQRIDDHDRQRPALTSTTSRRLPVTCQRFGPIRPPMRG